MEIMPLLTGVPPEWLPILIILALLLQGWKMWLERKANKDDDNTPAVG